MLLKRLEIQGFKSFADRTEIVFSPGVIAVVGPNGSGKSNISDAILWVLGEQNVRNLRGQKYQDVIFAGTDKRRSVGMAEVSLTVDNSDGKLPLEFSEVTITRRAYRSGEGEFFINKTPCRLKDIYELFLDTGVGREAYSIVSQGEIDAILSVKAEDRRELFDEAAGIKKYQVRKKEAEKKLENTEQNLSRVNDIIAEIESEIGPIAEQAQIAERYLELVDRLKEIETGILIADLHRYTDEIKKVCQEKEGFTKAISDADALIAALEEEKSALAIDLANADAQVERYSTMHQDALTHAERVESQLALVNQRHAVAEDAERLLTQEIAQIESRISQLQTQRASILSERERIEKEIAQLSERMAEKDAEIQRLGCEIENATRVANDEKSNYIELAKRLATHRNELVNTTTRIESLRGALERVSAEAREAERMLAQARSEKVNMEQDLAKFNADLERLQEHLANLKTKRTEAQTALAQAEEELSKVTRSLVDKEARLKTLLEMEDAREGYYLGVKSVTNALKKGLLSGSYAVVADVIEVPKGYEIAYEVALGSSLQDIITDSEEEAKSAISYLKKTNGGRATFLPLNRMRHTASPMLKELVGRNGVLGLGNDLIKFDPKYAPAIDALLARVLIAKDLDSAIAASRAAIGWSKIVTLEGDLILPSGAMTGGHVPAKMANLLTRKREIQSLRDQLQELSALTSRLKVKIETICAEYEKVSQEALRAEENDSQVRMALLEKQRKLEFTEKEVLRLAREYDALEAERNGVQQELNAAKQSESTLRKTIEAVEKENASLDEIIARVEQESKEMQDHYDSLTAEVGSLNVAIASLTQKKLNLEQIVETSRETERDLGVELYRKKDQLANALAEKAETDRKKSELQAELQNLHRKCEETQFHAEQWRKTKQSVLAASIEVSERLKEQSKIREEVTQKMHAAELREARLEVQIAQTTARLLEEYEISHEDALQMGVPEVKHGASAEVMRLRREIKSMGEVNTGAVQEYSRLKERLEFLSGQRQDLLEARRKLVDAIREIDESTKGIFLKTFGAVGEAFDRMFKRLFDGGSTQLVLTEPENVLESGIDVIVEMPGKKRQDLMLLSGGERALVAAALLFALLSVRPSPFCVLDEVDASLDEVNVGKFAEIVKEFAEKSQMIVITHNRATMEAADVLYGVTMQETGVSRVVSVRLSDVASVA